MLKPSRVAESKDVYDHKTSNKYWIDVQLRWVIMTLMILSVTLKPNLWTTQHITF